MFTPRAPTPSASGSLAITRRSALRLAVYSAIAAVAAACAPRELPGWTYGPTLAPATGAPGASAVPAGPATPAPASASPPAGGGPIEIRIVSEQIKFDLAEFSVPANTPFRIVFENRDAGVPHNVAIYERQAGGPELFKGEIFNGVETRTYEVPGLPAGNHYFQCDVHPFMNGTVKVG
ncbi:MAG: cupredoxin domain-containing protein [Chloroflexota bacterium]